MNYKSLIHSVKKSTFDEALKLSIEVRDKSQHVIGKLVPVGDWILDDKEKIELIRAWRQRTMRMFLTQFETSHEKTFDYIKNISIAQNNRILFLIYDTENRFIGHMGVANIDGNTGELDNLMRGIEGGDPRLVYFSEIALLDWCFRNLGISKSDVRVLSYNWLVISLHEEVGYVHQEKMPLKKITKDGITSHDFVAESDSNVKYSCVKLLLQKDAFYKTNNWLCL